MEPQGGGLMRYVWHHYVGNVRDRWQYFGAVDYRQSQFLESYLNADRWQQYLEHGVDLRKCSIVTEEYVTCEIFETGVFFRYWYIISSGR